MGSRNVTPARWRTIETSRLLASDERAAGDVAHKPHQRVVDHEVVIGLHRIGSVALSIIEATFRQHRQRPRAELP